MKTTPQVVTRNGKAVSVILPIAEYEELLERAEDASDLKWLKRARAGKLQYRPLNEYLSERKSKARA
jgi:PHD/YefM family antitoxin component YafN of YafNO toxin-antitoxin module